MFYKQRSDLEASWQMSNFDSRCLAVVFFLLKSVQSSVMLSEFKVVEKKVCRVVGLRQFPVLPFAVACSVSQW